MDADQVYRQFLKQLAVEAKPYRVKVSRNCIGMYQNMGDFFWRALIRPEPKPDGNIRLNTQVEIKPLRFDALFFEIAEPGRKVKITDLVRANRGFAFYTIESFSAAIENSAVEESMGKASKQILEQSQAAVDTFLQQVNTQAENIYEYFIAQCDKEPMLAGLSYMCLGNYEDSKKCFQKAEHDGKIWRFSFGPARRYLHCVLSDYCECMLTGSTWKEEFVTDGLNESNRRRLSVGPARSGLNWQ